MTTNTAWWNLPIEELEQMADDKGNIKLNTKIKATNPYSGQSADVNTRGTQVIHRDQRQLSLMRIIIQCKKKLV